MFPRATPASFLFLIILLSAVSTPAAPDSFFGQALDPEGNPVPNATIRLLPPWDPQKANKRPKPIVFTADEQGRTDP